MARECTKAFCADGLRFISAWEAAAGNYDLAIASGVLSYVPEPDEVLANLLDRSPWILISRLPLTDRPTDTPIVQVNSAEYGGLAYPAWRFSRDRFTATLSRSGEVVMRWSEPCGRGLTTDGFLLRRSELRRSPPIVGLEASVAPSAT